MNLFKKTTASIALVALVSGVFSAGVSANSTTQIEAANALAAKGFINSQADAADYNLNLNVSRGEIAKVAAKMAGIEAKSTCDNSFADVSATTPNTWVCGYAEALLDAGAISANTNFRPEDNISKSEAVKMVLEAAGYEGIYTNASNWQEEVVAFAADKSIFASFTNYNTPATRGFIFETANNSLISIETVDAIEDEGFENMLCAIMETCDETVVEETPTEVVVDAPVVISGENTLTVELSPETPTSGFVAAAIPRTAILAFDVQAGSEDVVLEEVRLDYTGLSDYNDINTVKMYIDNEQVSKGSGRNFNDKFIEISFENGTFIKAGSTQTIVVTAEVVNNANSSHQITLTDLVASVDVEMEDVSSMTFSTVTVSNISELRLDIDSVSGSDITVGETIKLADFELEERNDNEDVILKSLTFALGGSMDHQDDISDITLTVNGEEVASNLTVNNDEEIIVSLDLVIPADEKAIFELTAIVTGSVTETLDVTISEIYAIGSETGINSRLDAGGDQEGDVVATSRTIEGSEINVSFDRSDIDEAKPDAEEVSIGTLTLSTDGEYNIDRIEVTVVSSSAVAVPSILNKIELDGRGFDTESRVALTTSNATAAAVLPGDTTVYYYFEDISLNNETLELPLTFDVIDNVLLDGENLDFTVKLISVEDEENNETYDVSSGNLGNILSTNALSATDIDIATATITFSSTSVNANLLVLGNGIESVAYKGKINVGDADLVTLTDLNFIQDATDSITGDLDKILESATLNIGGQTFDADIDADSVDFSTNLDIDAGSDNVSVLVTVVFKDDGASHNSEILVLEVDTAALTNDVEDSDGNTVTNITTTTINTNLAQTTLLDNGDFTFSLIDDVDTNDNLENVVLGGSNGVTLAELELEAEYEDMEIKELVFTNLGADLTSTLENVRIVSSSNVIADGAVVTFDGINTLITFEDFIVTDSSNLVEAELVADINPITGVSGETSAIVANINIDYTSIDVKGYNSNDPIVATTTNLGTEIVSVVPSIVVPSMNTSLSTSAIPRLSIYSDSGNNTDANEQAIDSILETIEFSTLGTSSLGAVFTLVNENDSTDTILGTLVGTTLTFNVTDMTANNRTVDDGETEVFKIVVTGTVADDTIALTLPRNGVTYSSNGTTGITTDLQSEIDFGTRSY